MFDCLFTIDLNYKKRVNFLFPHLRQWLTYSRQPKIYTWSLLKYHHIHFWRSYTKTSLKTVTTHNQFVDRLGYVWWQKPTRHCRDFKRSNKKLCGSLEFCALSIYRGYETYKQRYVVKWLDYYPCAPCNNAILPSICLR